MRFLMMFGIVFLTWSIVVALVMLAFGIDLTVDENDVLVNSKVSVLNLYTDNRNGCQYLGTRFGGLTPRLDANGNHICTGSEK